MERERVSEPKVTDNVCVIRDIGKAGKNARNRIGIPLVQRWACCLVTSSQDWSPHQSWCMCGCGLDARRCSRLTTTQKQHSAHIKLAKRFADTIFHAVGLRVVATIYERSYHFNVR